MDNVEIVNAGGAGNKGYSCLFGEADAYLFPAPGLKFWDVCAIDALSKSVGAYISDDLGKEHTYFAEQNPLIRGLVLSKYETIYAAIMNALYKVRE